MLVECGRHCRVVGSGERVREWRGTRCACVCQVHGMVSCEVRLVLPRMREAQLMQKMAQLQSGQGYWSDSNSAQAACPGSLGCGLKVGETTSNTSLAARGWRVWLGLNHCPCCCRPPQPIATGSPFLFSFFFFSHVFILPANESRPWPQGFRPLTLNHSATTGFSFVPDTPDLKSFILPDTVTLAP